MLEWLFSYRPAHFISYSRDTYHMIIESYSVQYQQYVVVFSIVIVASLIIHQLKPLIALKLLATIAALFSLFFIFTFHMKELVSLSPVAYVFALYFFVLAIQMIKVQRNSMTRMDRLSYIGYFILLVTAFLPHTVFGFRDDVIVFLSFGIYFICQPFPITKMIYSLFWFMTAFVYLI